MLPVLLSGVGVKLMRVKRQNPKRIILANGDARLPPTNCYVTLIVFVLLGFCLLACWLACLHLVFVCTFVCVFVFVCMFACVCVCVPPPSVHTRVGFLINELCI